MIIKINYKLTAYVLSAAFLVCVVCSLFTPHTRATVAEEVALPVIMYHHISKDYKALNDYVISPEELEADFKYLKEKGYTAILPESLREYISGKASLPEKPVIITFDDGFESVYHYAYPLAKEYGFPFVLSVLGKEAEHYSSIDDHNILYSYINWDIIKELAGSGIVEIANHTFDLHEVYPRKGVNIKKGENAKEYTRLVTEDIEKLQNLLKTNSEVTPKTFVYPFGFACKEAQSIVRDMGFTVSFSCNEGINIITKNPEELQLLKRYNRPHGIASEDFFKRNNIE